MRKCSTLISLPLGLFVVYCGRAEPDFIPLMRHASVTDPGKWPWHSVLYVFEEGSWNFWCGGSLISERVVLTGKATVYDMQRH